MSWSVNPDLSHQGVTLGRAMSKTVTVSRWTMTEIGSRLSYKWDVRVRSGLNADNYWTLVLVDKKSEVLGGTCGTSDTEGVS